MTRPIRSSCIWITFWLASNIRIEVIRLDPQQSALLIKTANEAAWDAVVKTSPTHGAKLREMMAPK